MSKERPLVERDGYLEVPLTRGKVAKVDIVDRHLVEGRLWRFVLGYAVSQEVSLHRWLLGLPPGQRPEVDHINGDSLDNRRSNLRVCSHSQNGANSGPQKNQRFKGVIWDKQRGGWRARIQFEKKTIHLGRFLSEEEAALAYNKGAMYYFGSFAKLNDVK